MAKTVWRLILNSIITTVLLVALGVPAMDVVAILGLFGCLLWAQEELIIQITERRERDTRDGRW